MDPRALAESTVCGLCNGSRGLAPDAVVGDVPLCDYCHADALMEAYRVCGREVSPVLEVPVRERPVGDTPVERFMLRNFWRGVVIGLVLVLLVQWWWLAR